MDQLFIIVSLVVIVALIFDFTNGFHDSANSIATIVSTRVLTPWQAVCWAACFNFLAFFIFGTTVAKTVGKGLIDITTVTPYVILAGLIGTIIWNIITWYLGLPTSSSHALIGGYAGAAIAKAGFGVILFGGWAKTLIFMVVAPLIGLALGSFLFIVVSWCFYKVSLRFVNTWSRRMQLVSAALYSMGHGGNDAQKTAGIITGALVTGGFLSEFSIPLWVAIAAYSVISLGTLFGGWRIVKTMGQGITKLQPMGGFCAETASAASLFFATHLGVPVSTTHVITGAISGVGATKRLSAVRWALTLQIVWAWILTIPLAGAIGGGIYILAYLIIAS